MPMPDLNKFVDERFDRMGNPKPSARQAAEQGLKPGEKPVEDLSGPAAGAVYNTPDGYTIAALGEDTFEVTNPEGKKARVVKGGENGNLWDTVSEMVTSVKTGGEQPPEGVEPKAE
jgi:hypothetical protein